MALGVVFNGESCFFHGLYHQDVIGGGSNLLVRDGGVPGVVIRLDSPGFRKISFGENTVTCGAGVKNAEALHFFS